MITWQYSQIGLTDARTFMVVKKSRIKRKQKQRAYSSEAASSGESVDSSGSVASSVGTDGVSES